MNSYLFRVYVAGQTERTQTALANMRALCEARLPGRYELEVIDTMERPDLAAGDAILIAPTVIRVTPWPQCRVYGDLSDHERTVAALGLPGVDSQKGGDQ